MSEPPGFGEEASILDEIDEEAERLADERAGADIAAGRVVSHEAAIRRLRSWGAPDERPPPKRHG